MAGPKRQKEKLNAALLWAIGFLKQARVPPSEWFVSYGTLLGLLRESSCIDGDDDVDIVIMKDAFDKLWRFARCTSSATASRIHTVRKSKYSGIARECFMQLRSPDGVLVEFYMAERRDTDTTIFDWWSNLLWKDALPTETLRWRGVDVSVPRDPTDKVERLYGKDWRVPQQKKSGKTGIRSYAEL